MNYRFHPAAATEHLELIAFYEARQAGLGARYREHFLKTIRNVCERPARYPIERQPDIRRVRLRVFPLTIIYRERDAMIQVLAVAHYRRRSGYWFGRATRSSS